MLGNSPVRSLDVFSSLYLINTAHRVHTLRTHPAPAPAPAPVHHLKDADTPAALDIPQVDSRHIHPHQGSPR